MNTEQTSQNVFTYNMSTLGNYKQFNIMIEKLASFYLEDPFYIKIL